METVYASKKCNKNRRKALMSSEKKNPPSNKQGLHFSVYFDWVGLIRSRPLPVVVEEPPTNDVLRIKAAFDLKTG